MLKSIILKTLLFIVALLLLMVLFLGGLFLMRPTKSNASEQLFQGVSYRREVRQSPRPLMIHIVPIDLTAPGVGVFITPGDDSGGMELIARTTSKFLADFDVQVAINGGFFSPMHSNGPWDYAPHNGDPINVSGLAISNGLEYSPANDYSAVLCVDVAGRAHITPEICPANTWQSLAGNMMLVVDGAASNLNGFDPDEIAFFQKLHPRTVVALDESRETMWFLVVDGRQSGYSEGTTLSETIDLALKLGADTALHLDGGGSTTLVTEGQWWPRALNAPIHTRIPMRQRPVANHVGIYARQVTP